jgi:hypothetical protein
MTRTSRSTVTRGTAVLAVVMLLTGVGAARAQDPGLPGPYAVTVEEYDFGDLAFSPSGFPSAVEVRGSVHYPTGLPGGPYPVVVFLHGRHSTCYEGTSAYLQWPCWPGRAPIPSYQGYDYVGSVIASHGYIVISVSANGVNAFDSSVADRGMQARAELLQHHLDRWNTFNTTGGSPFGRRFVGKLDLRNVGTMGHSRGGEGVVWHYLLNRSLGSPYGITAVFPLAPVNFHRRIIDGVALGVLLPYCDGDVSSLPGVHYHDDARYTMPGDPAAKHYLLVMGANHNFYNTVWTPGLFPAGAVDDWTAYVSGGSFDSHCGPGGSGRLPADAQRGTGLAYLAAFFRTYLGGETAFAGLLKGDDPPPPSAQSDAIYLSYHAPAAPAARRDVNRLLESSALTTNTLGGAVTRSGFTPYDLCGGEGQPTPCLPTQVNSRQPHTAPSTLSAAPGLSQLRAGWSASTASYTNDIPPGYRDLTGYQMLQFRAGLNFEDTRSLPGRSLNFSVVLTDGTGASADVQVAAFSTALFYPPGEVGPVPRVVLQTIRLPLAAFTGIDRRDVRSIRFRFNQTSSGAILLSDLAFADPSGAVPGEADLFVSALATSPASATPGGAFTAIDTVVNLGGAPAAASTLRYYLSADTVRTGDDRRLTGSRAVGALAAGASSSGSVPAGVPADMPLGTYHLIACADDLDAVPESSEDNNCRASTATVRVVPAGMPDLQVTSLSGPPTTVELGRSFVVDDTQRNAGNWPAGASTTRFYLSTDALRGGADKRLAGSRAVPGLAEDASSSGTASLTVKESVPRGTYFLVACADDLKAVAESNEKNNCRASAGVVRVLAADLVVTAISNPPASAPIGTTFTVADTARNQGDASAGASTTRYYFSTDETKGAGDARLVGERAVPSLAPGAASAGAVSVRVPVTTPSGVFRLLACADDRNKVLEAGGKNNCSASATTVVVP